MPTLSVVVYHADLGGIRLGLRHSDGRRVGHRGHGCGWHHQGRHNSNKNTLKFVHNESRPSDRGKVTEDTPKSLSFSAARSKRCSPPSRYFHTELTVETAAE